MILLLVSCTPLPTADCIFNHYYDGKPYCSKYRLVK